MLNDDKSKAHFCISRKIASTNLSKKVVEALQGYDLPTLKNSTSQRIIYAKSAAELKSFFEIKQSNDAIVEIANIVNEIKEII
tara:strand:- start:487 stop:735 length:249 start_codon:yes stop_codon:yes gene_type:complete